MEPAPRSEPSDPEILQRSPGGTWPFGRLSPAWRRRGLVLATWLVGVLSGAGVVWWWDGGAEQQVGGAPTRSATALGGQEVRLVLTRAGALRRDSRQTGGAAYLRVDGALLYDGRAGDVTVRRIYRPGGGLLVRVPRLPVVLSANRAYEPIRLQIAPGDCRLATEWTPSAQPLTLTWRDEQGRVQRSSGGDHDPVMELTLIRWLDDACDGRTGR